MAFLDIYSLSALSEEKRQSLLESRDRLYQEYFQKQEEARRKESAIELSAILNAEVEKVPQGVNPYFNPNELTPVDMLNLYGANTDADSVRRLRRSDIPGAEFGLRYTPYDLTAPRTDRPEIKQYRAAGSEGQIQDQVSWLKNLLETAGNPNRQPTEADIFRLGAAQTNQFREQIRREQGPVDPTTGKLYPLPTTEAIPEERGYPQALLGYNPESLDYVGSNRIRGDLLSPITGKSYFSGSNTPLTNTRWFSDDPAQVAVRKAWEKENTTKDKENPYSQFKDLLPNSYIDKNSNGTYNITDARSNITHRNVTEENALTWQKVYDNIDTTKIKDSSKLNQIHQAFTRTARNINYLTGGLLDNRSSLEDTIELNNISYKEVADIDKEFRTLRAKELGDKKGLLDQFMYTLNYRKEDAFEGLLESAPLMAELMIPFIGIPVASSDIYANLLQEYTQENNINSKDISKTEKAILFTGATLSAGAELLGLKAVLGRSKIVNEVVNSLVAKNGILGKLFAKATGATGSIVTEGVTGIISEQSEKTASDLAEEARKADVQNRPIEYIDTIANSTLSGSEAVEAFQMEAMGAFGPSAVSSAVDLATNTTDNQIIKRIEKELATPEYVPLTPKEENKLFDRRTKFESAQLRPNISDERKQALQKKIDEIDTLLEKGKINPKGLDPKRRAVLEKRLETIKAKQDTTTTDTGFNQPAGVAASAAQPAATGELVTASQQELLDNIGDKVKTANERAAAATTLETKLNQDQSVETAQTVINAHDEARTAAKESETKLGSLANVIDPSQVVDPDKLTDSDIKEVYDIIEEFNAADTSIKLDEIANDVSTGASVVSSNILNTSKNNFKSVKEHFTDLVEAIKNRDIPKVKNIARNLQKFRASHTGKSKAVNQAIKELKTAKDNAAIIITRTPNAQTGIPSYTLTRTTLEEAKKAQKEFSDKTDKEGKNVFFIGKGKVSSKLVAAINIESKFLKQAHTIAKLILSTAEEIEANKLISETLGNAVTKASDILNKNIPETVGKQNEQAANKETGSTQQTKSNTTEETPKKSTSEQAIGEQENGNQEEVQEEGQQENAEQENVTPKKYKLLRDIILDNWHEKDLPASTIKRMFDRDIAQFKAVASSIRKGTC